MANIPLHSVGLDIGTSKVRCVIGESTEKGLLNIIGIGEAESHGLRRGIVTKTETVIDAIKEAVEKAERVSGLEIQIATVNLSGENLKGENKRGVVAVAGPEKEITNEDVERAIESACAMPLSAGWEIVDKLPQEFIVDGQDGIIEPIGMSGSRLESKVHVVTSPSAGRQNAIKAIHRAGLDIEYMMLEQLAAAEATLTDDDKEYGSALVNIGAEITGLIIFQNGAVRHTAVFPFGGTHFTKDIAVGLRASIPEAERIKREYGCVASYLLSESQNQELIKVMPVGREIARELPRQILCDMLQPRAEELLQHVAGEISRAIGERQLSSGIVLSGGGAMLDGMVEIAEQIFDAPTRLGFANKSLFGGLIDEVNRPDWSTVCGLSLFSMRSQMNSAQSIKGGKSSSERFSEWFGTIRDKFR